MAEKTMPLSAGLDARLEELRAGLAFRAYADARGHVLRMKEQGGAAARPAGEARPSDYWREELSNVDYMLDASPLVVESLRRHCFHVTGDWAYRYRSGTDAAARAAAAKLEALAALDRRGLRVPESPALGGFGHELDGGLYNIDTLKFYEALVAMDLGGALELLDGGEPRLVWEVGGGWGGFAHQVKTLFPNVTYVITDLPELFLFSAVYLRTLHPGASVRFVHDAEEAASGGWLEHDFVFVPHTATAAMAPERLDLTVNTVSFQEMTSGQVRGYVERAAALSSPALYSLNRRRSPYNAELSSVDDLIAERFETREVPVLDVEYTQSLPAGALGRARGAAGRAVERLRRAESNRYRHLVGRRS